jgi:hypothetical protein
MKRAKIALTAIAVFAVVGGALAFKARTASIFYVPSTAGAACSVPTTYQLTTTLPGQGTLVSYSIAPTTTTCATYVVFNQ